MPLTEMLKHQDVRERFDAEFPKPKLALPKFTYVPPTNLSHRHLMGTAFDYVLRFHMAAINENVLASPWVAERAATRLVRAIAKRWPVFAADRSILVSNRRFRRVTFDGKSLLVMDRELSNRERGVPDLARRIIVDARREYAKCCNAGKVSKKLLRSALLLGQLDVYGRSNLLDDGFGTSDDDDVEELRRLLEVARRTPQSPFVASRVCLLNPTFGEASALVGGADADMLIDDTLIELKTEQELRFRRETFRQLMGYYVLHTIGGFGMGAKQRPPIRHIAMYSSRFGAFARIPVKSIVNFRTFPAFVRWFKQRALLGPTRRTTTFACEDGTTVTV